MHLYGPPHNNMNRRDFILGLLALPFLPLLAREKPSKYLEYRGMRFVPDFQGTNLLLSIPGPPKKTSEAIQHTVCYWLNMT